MSAEKLKVVTEDLKKLSKGMTAQPWPTAAAQARAADGLPLAGDAATNLNDNAQQLVAYQKFAEAENQRLAETLSNVADAYDAVDHAAKETIDDLGGRPAAIEAITIPAPATQLPAIPDGGGASLRALDGGGYGDVMQTQALLTQGDFGSAIVAAQGGWSVMKGAADTHAQPPAPTNWEGDAATEAYTRLNAYSSWLGQLSDAWHRLIQAGGKVRQAHITAVSEHTGVAEAYQKLEAQLKEPVADHPGLRTRIMQEMKKLHERSDEIRAAYASSATFDAVRPADPPFGSTAGAGGGSAGGGGRAGGGGGAGGAHRAAAPMSASAPAKATGAPPPSDSTSSGGSPSGGGAPAGGGAPEGGGSPATGSPGTPEGPSTDLPTLPDDPSLHPAAVGGGAGAGAGGGAGGGAGPMPLQPNVGGVAVGPATASGAAAGSPAGGTSGSAAGAGMGGMPMGGHGQGQGGGKEKRRTPGLAPDEDLYTEERPWTEAIIGNRRRKDVQDPKDST